MRRLLIALALPLAVQAETPADRWNLAAIYPSDRAWHDAAALFADELERIAECRGKVAKSAIRFKACLDFKTELQKRLRKLQTYASERFAEDTGAAAGMELRQKAQLLGSKFQEQTAFFRPEILAAGAGGVAAFLAEDPALALYRRPLDVILRQAPHTLDGAGESLLASFGLVTQAADSAYTTLTNADLPWPSVRLSSGALVRLDPTGYTKYRTLRNRIDRKKVFDAFWGAWKTYENTFGVTFQEAVRTESVYAKVRRYPDALARRLEPERIPLVVYDTLIAQANASLPTLYRYFRLRAKLLGVRDLRYHDIYAPLVDDRRKVPLEEAKRILLESVAPLGADYVANVRKGLDQRWMDAYPRPRKLSGAHVNGGAHDVHPFVLMNYHHDYESVQTRAPEWGHASHSHLANEAQPFVTAGYATFVAEIASTLNEALLLEHMLKTARNDDERLLCLGAALENLRGTFFRQAMFAEFEREVHARMARGEPLTGPALTRIYGELLRRHHGHDEGVVKIDDLYAIEWAYVPHFYSSFYVFQYATSIAASAQFADAILKGEPGARERYLNLLKAGGADDPYAMVKAAGVDLATPAPYQALIAQMNRIMDEIESIQARRTRKPR